MILHSADLLIPLFICTGSNLDDDDDDGKKLICIRVIRLYSADPLVPYSHGVVGKWKSR